MTDEYLTVKKEASAEIKVKGSRFIGRCSPAGGRQEAETFIERIRKKHHDATHNCSAFRTGFADSADFRYNDDGEPAGTAGRPILDAIKGRGLTNVVCVVTRYFGGTKLGSGGLVRAYGGCASACLKRAGLRKQYITQRYIIRFDYDLTGPVMNCITTLGGKITSTNYTSRTAMSVEIRKSLAERLKRELTDSTAGRIEIGAGESDAD